MLSRLRSGHGALDESKSSTDLDLPASKVTPRWAWTPLNFAMAWLLGTLCVFFLTEASQEVPSLVPMLSVAGGGALFFAAGYWLQIRRRIRCWRVAREVGTPPTGLIIASCIWAVLYGFFVTRAWAQSGSVMDAVLNPGLSYRMKNDSLNSMEYASKNLGAQLLYLTAALQTFFVPLGMVWWSKLGLAVRALIMLAILAYLVPFAATGTFQGFGYMAVYALVGYGVLRARRGNRSSSSWRSRVVVAAVICCLAIVWGGYQSSRSDAYDDYASNGTVARILGSEVGLAWESAVYYPTHGYLGLSQALTQPFVFTGGYGSSKALNRYASSYFGMPDQELNTYPSRTEYYTGYPATRLWQTVYPWLASDVTFPGAVLCMAGVGFVAAGLWRRSVATLDSMAIGLFCYVGLFVAWIPANNTVFALQSNVIGLVSLTLLAALGRVLSVGKKREF